MTLIDFSSYKNTQNTAANEAIVSVDDIQLLVLRFLECNSQHICGVMCHKAAQTLYNGFVVDFFADVPDMSLSERAVFIGEVIAVITTMQVGTMPVLGLSELNAHVLSRLIDRLRLELPPIPDFTVKLLRMVMTRHGTAHKLEEFITFSRSARYAAAHWMAMSRLAQQKGGRSGVIANILDHAVTGLAMPAEVSAVAKQGLQKIRA